MVKPISWASARPHRQSRFSISRPSTASEGDLPTTNAGTWTRAARRHQSAAPVQCATRMERTIGTAAAEPLGGRLRRVLAPDPRDMPSRDLYLDLGLATRLATPVNVMTPHQPRAQNPRLQRLLFIDPPTAPAPRAFAYMHLEPVSAVYRRARFCAARLCIRVPRTARRPRLHGPVRRLPNALEAAPEYARAEWAAAITG